MRDDEARTSPPRVRPEASGAPHVGEMIPIDDLKSEAEFRREFVAPLFRHGGRGRDHDEVDPAS